MKDACILRLLAFLRFKDGNYRGLRKNLGGSSMRKIIKLGFVLFICMFVICGCEKNEVKNEEEYVWGSEEIPEHIERTISENAYIDADVTVFSGFEAGKADILEINMQEVDRDLVFKVLSEGRELKEKYSEEYDNETVDYYDFEDRSKLSIGNTWFNYFSEFSEYIWYCCRFQDGQSGNNEEIFKQNETDFSYMSMQEAEEQCYELLEDIGLTVHEKSLKAYRLEHNTLREQEDVIVMEQLPEETQPKPKPEWTTEDDSYMFYFYPTVNGFGLIPNAYSAQSERIMGIQTHEVIYNRNGVAKIGGAQNAITVKKVLQKEVPLLNIEGALKRVSERYEQLIGEQEIWVKEVQLGYVVEQKEGGVPEKLIPVWCFRIEEKRVEAGQEYTMYVCLLIDATTGEEIY